MQSPHGPTKYLGPNVFYPATVTVNRRPTSTDIIQPTTGKYYLITSLWQVGKNPTTGVEGEVWLLTKIVANTAYWELITGGATAGTVVGLRDSSGDIVGPDGTGIIDVIGDSNSIITTNVDGILPFTMRVNIKAGEKNATGVAGKAGAVSVNSTQFNIDANGWISLVGGVGPATNSYTTDVSSPVVPLAGVLALTGSTTTYTSGAVANTVRTEVQGTNHALFVGRGSQTPATNLAVGATNTVLLGVTGADPAFGTVPNAALTNSSITLSNGNNITVTGSPVSLGGAATIAVTGTINHAVQLGNASGSLSSITPPTSAYAVLRAQGTNPDTTDPQWITSGTSFNATFTNFNGSYISQAGRYLRFGNMVFLQINMDWTGNSATGDMIINNCPFVFGSALSHYVGSVLITDVTLPVLTIQVVCDGSNATTNLNIKAVLDNAPSSNVQMNAAGTMSLTLMYFAVSA